ncbi:beta-N-acetylhexosaminidase [Shewanella inventionis]|uniref:Beta-hexosaminidase n=1 Tax=Shewanella inventionis TaxID=1738770 RepID=A0ABQ1J7L1_9GAMM|nr:beta-N-acetylhexosaminidase [Shewanella inventionis]MCL1157673.1 beta-N-acetylhexosaminidase [Shewanella inventionis]GGB59854.1 beta-hexosaminidase [Shewanella inventionis]
MSYLMMDLAGLTVSQLEAEQLRHPKVGGIILFSRNFENKSQLIELVKQIRSIRPELLVAVDHEGGRVQRFRDGFSAIPAMGDILPAANMDLTLAKQWAKECGFLMAIELLACDIDLSFAPVLDVNGISEVIGTRSFSPEPEVVSALAEQFIVGMNDAGMAAVGKHFPGHGSVAADSHIAMPVDPRPKEVVEAFDMLPFKQLIAQHQLQGVMPAHVVYSAIDPNPAGFSPYWLQTVLRNQLAFNGVIFSDDLGMKGASFAGDYLGRAKAALDAGCDMILVCNDPVGVSTLLTDFVWPADEPLHTALALKGKPEQVRRALAQQERILAAQQLVNLCSR